MIDFPGAQMRVVFMVKGDAGWHQGFLDVMDELVVTTSMAFSPREIVCIRACPLRPGNGERNVPVDRGRVDLLADLRFEALVVGMMRGIPAKVLWDLAVKSAGPEDRNRGTVVLDPEERQQIALSEASELHSTATVDEEEALAVGE